MFYIKLRFAQKISPKKKFFKKLYDFENFRKKIFDPDLGRFHEVHKVWPLITFLILWIRTSKRVIFEALSNPYPEVSLGFKKKKIWGLRVRCNFSKNQFSRSKIVIFRKNQKVSKWTKMSFLRLSKPIWAFFVIFRLQKKKNWGNYSEILFIFKNQSC